MTTTNLSDFGYRELDMLATLIKAMAEQGLPEDFEDDEVIPMMNQNSGNVFLTNSEYQVAMLNGKKLERFYTLPYSGEEGFKDELEGLDFESLHEDDARYLVDIEVMGEDQFDEIFGCDEE